MFLHEPLSVQFSKDVLVLVVPPFRLIKMTNNKYPRRIRDTIRNFAERKQKPSALGNAPVLLLLKTGTNSRAVGLLAQHRKTQAQPRANSKAKRIRSCSFNSDLNQNDPILRIFLRGFIRVTCLDGRIARELSQNR